MKTKVKGVSPETPIVTNLGILDVKHLACVLTPNVKVEPRNNFKVKNIENDWVTVTAVTNLGQQSVRDIVLSDGRSYVFGEDQEVLTNKGFLCGNDIKENLDIVIHSECDIDRAPIHRLQGYPNTIFGDDSLSLIKLLGIITAFGVVTCETGVVGLKDIPARVSLEFTTLMEKLFKLDNTYLTITTQSRGTTSLHYTHLGLARWMYGILSNGVPYEIMSASKEQILMFINGMSDPRYLQVKSSIRGGKYVYNGSKYQVARQVFSLLRSLGYSPVIVDENNGTHSVLTIGVNVLEDNVNKTTTDTNNPVMMSIKETCNYLDELYLIEIEYGNNFILDGILINVGE